MSLRFSPTKFKCLVVAAALGWSCSEAVADPLNCSLSQYKAISGLTAVADAATLTLTWDGDRNQELRLRLGITEGTPTIQDLSVKRRGGSWASLATNVTPEFRVVSGIRRMDNQSLEGLRKNGITEITKPIFDAWGWDTFWDAPLHVPGDEGDLKRRTPGVPRKPEEVTRGTAVYRTQSCEVVTDGARINVVFPGVSLGVFEGRLQFTVYKGSRHRRLAAQSLADVLRRSVRRFDDHARRASSRIIHGTDVSAQRQCQRLPLPRGNRRGRPCCATKDRELADLVRMQIAADGECAGLARRKDDHVDVSRHRDVRMNLLAGRTYARWGRLAPANKLAVVVVTVLVFVVDEVLRRTPGLRHPDQIVGNQPHDPVVVFRRPPVPKQQLYRVSCGNEDGRWPDRAVRYLHVDRQVVGRALGQYGRRRPVVHPVMHVDLA